MVVGAVCREAAVLPGAVRREGGSARGVARAYAEAIDPISDVRGSADYRRRVIAVEVRRALEEIA